METGADHLRGHLFALVGALTRALHGSTATVSLRSEGVSLGMARAGEVPSGSRAEADG
jgi:hypothetical protein